MRYVSLFSGVEAATVAWSKLGWQPLAFAEVDPFPCAVLAHRFPDIPNLGDVCEIDWEDFYGRHGAIDVLIGGSPCQSFSIAGGREGLEGESRLMFEYIRAVRDLVRVSEGRSPRYIVWENVPGCLSSNRGKDFECLLDELDECGYFLEWRTLDSQFTRVFDRGSGRFRGPVPQRRRRVYLVGSLGGPSAANILIERTSLRGDHPKGRAAREALAEHLEGCPGMGDSAGFKWYAGAKARGIGYEEGTSPTIAVSDSHVPAVLTQQTEDGCLTPWDNESKRVFGINGAMPTIYAAGNSGQQQQSVLVPEVLTPWDVQSKRVNMPHGTSPTLQSGSGEGMTIQPIVLTTANTKANGSNVSEEGIAYTIDLANSNAVCVQGNIVDRETGGADGIGVRDDGASYTLTANDKHVVAFAQNNRSEVRLFGGDGQTVGALAANPDFGKGQGGSIICIDECISDSEINQDYSPTLRKSHHKQPPLLCFNAGSKNDVAYIGESQKEISPTLKAGRSGTNGTPVVCMESSQGRAVVLDDGASPTLNASNEQTIVCMADDNARCAIDEDMCGTLKIGGCQPIIARRMEEMADAEGLHVED